MSPFLHLVGLILDSRVPLPAAVARKIELEGGIQPLGGILVERGGHPLECLFARCGSCLCHCCLLYFQSRPARRWGHLSAPPQTCHQIAQQYGQLFSERSRTNVVSCHSAHCLPVKSLTPP